MPENRFVHPRLGHSEKVNLLTDLEFRVWVQYLLSADDFGVMRFSAVTIQAANDSLHQKSTKVVQRCLERLVDVGLLVDFEHQGRKFLCQLDWHTWQRFNMPSRTMNPPPPLDVLARCDEGTYSLFRDHHYAFVDVPFDAHQPSSLDVPHEAPLITANGKRLTPNGLRERFADFWKLYPRKVGKDAAWKSWQKIKPTTNLLAQMLSVLAWQKQQDGWLKDGGQYVPHPSTWLNQGRWEDEPVEAPNVNASTLKAFTATKEFLAS